MRTKIIQSGFLFKDNEVILKLIHFLQGYIHNNIATLSDERNLRTTTVFGTTKISDDITHTKE